MMKNVVLLFFYYWDAWTPSWRNHTLAFENNSLLLIH